MLGSPPAGVAGERMQMPKASHTAGFMRLPLASNAAAAAPPAQPHHATAQPASLTL
jgi:hypothetical protein